MKAVTSEEMRELDRRTIAEFGVPGEMLMDRAGQGVARAVRRLIEWSGRTHPAVKLFAGRGNNGGDAFVAARYLHEWGIPSEVWLAGARDAVSGDARTHLARMHAAGVPLHEWAEADDWNDRSVLETDNNAILVDGLLGTGTTGPARGAIAAAIRCINQLAGRNPVVAIDLPSGLNADTGERPGDTVRADLTVTLGLPKCGLLEPAAVEWVGSLDVVDIGIPPELLEGPGSGPELIVESEVRAMIRRRPRTAHKGVFGHVLIVAGAAGFAGAAGLAARAAARSGAGLVTVLTPAMVAPAVTGMVPEAMVHFGAQTPAGRLASDSLRKWGRNLADFDSVLIGPGLTPGDETRDVVLDVLKYCRGPVILDADALNVCAGRIHMVRAVSIPVILTPHPGEMARLLGVGVADVQADRRGVSSRAAELSGATVVLKGAGTLVTEPDGATAVNLTGNPGMASGGTGDVLGGVMAGWLAQGLAPRDAARVAVFAHGRAGDRAAWRLSQAGMTAGDLVDELPHTWRELGGR